MRGSYAIFACLAYLEFGQVLMRVCRDKLATANLPPSAAAMALSNSRRSGWLEQRLAAVHRGHAVSTPTNPVRSPGKRKIGHSRRHSSFMRPSDRQDHRSTTGSPIYI